MPAKKKQKKEVQKKKPTSDIKNLKKPSKKGKSAKKRSNPQHSEIIKVSIAELGDFGDFYDEYDFIPQFQLTKNDKDKILSIAKANENLSEERLTTELEKNLTDCCRAGKIGDKTASLSAFLVSAGIANALHRKNPNNATYLRLSKIINSKVIL